MTDVVEKEHTRDAIWDGNERRRLVKERTPPPTCHDEGDCTTWRNWVTASLVDGADRFQRQEAAVAENTRITLETSDKIDALSTNFSRNKESLDSLIEFLKGAKMGIGVVHWVGRKIMWCGKQATWLLPLGGLLYFIKTGHWPKTGD